MLIIAIGHGTGHDTDPFTCSTNCVVASIKNDPGQCLRYICEDKQLDPSVVDELLIVDADDDSEPEVLRHYTAANDWDDEYIDSIREYLDA